MKTIYTKLIQQLREEEPRLKWIDLNTGQLDTAQRPPVTFPCALIDITVNRTEAHTTTLQECHATITLTIANDRPTRTNTKAKMKKSEALEDYDHIANIYKALQGYTGDELFSPLNRTRQERLRSTSGLFLYRMSFSTTFLDLSNQP